MWSSVDSRRNVLVFTYFVGSLVGPVARAPRGRRRVQEAVLREAM